MEIKNKTIVELKKIAESVKDELATRKRLPCLNKPKNMPCPSMSGWCKNCYNYHLNITE